MDFTAIELSKDFDTPGRFFQRKNKHYALDQMLTPSEKMCTHQKIKINSRKIEEKKSQYFQNMIKEQNKKVFIATFIKKLKRTIVREFPAEHQSLHLHEKTKKFLNGVYISPFFEFLLSAMGIVQISFVMVIISLSTVFQSVYTSQLYVSALLFGFWFHILDIVKSIVSVKNHDGKRFDKLNDIVNIYVKNQGFSDCLILIAYLCEFIFYDHSLTKISQYLFLIKIIPLQKKLQIFERHIIQNVYWEQVWELAKLFLVNYIFAHFLALVLLSMARLNESESWMAFRNIHEKPQIEQYVWAYYWATTIMLTVGFGDIVPVNSSEALCMIFVETISCILLAYNINNVGEIISKIRSYSLLQQTNLKTFRNISSTNSIPSELTHRISNYIKESVEMKRKSNISEENKFIETLPNSFKEDLLKECNKKIFTELLFLKNLSEKNQFELAVQIERKLTHPEEVLHHRKDPLDIMIFNSGTVAYTYFRNSDRALYSNGKIVQTHKTSKSEFKMLSLDFLFNSYFPFNVKCIDYTTVYKITTKALTEVLKGNPYDYEYFCMTKDKDKLLVNEFEIYECEICPKEKHSLDKCPKLHFLPLRQHIIHKFLGHKLSQYLMIRLRNPRISKSQYKPFIDKKEIKEDLLRKRVEQRDLLNRSVIQRTLIAINSIDHNSSNTDDHPNEIQGSSQNSEDSVSIQQDLIRPSHSAYLDAKEMLKDEMSKVINLQQNKQMMWEIEADVIHDFKYYFKKYNPQKMNIFLKKKVNRRRRKFKGVSMKTII